MYAKAKVDAKAVDKQNKVTMTTLDINTRVHQLVLLLFFVLSHVIHSRKRKKMVLNDPTLTHLTCFGHHNKLRMSFSLRAAFIYASYSEKELVISIIR